MSQTCWQTPNGGTLCWPPVVTPPVTTGLPPICATCGRGGITCDPPGSNHCIAIASVPCPPSCAGSGATSGGTTGPGTPPAPSGSGNPGAAPFYGAPELSAPSYPYTVAPATAAPASGGFPLLPVLAGVLGIGGVIWYVRRPAAPLPHAGTGVV